MDLAARQQHHSHWWPAQYLASWPRLLGWPTGFTAKKLISEAHLTRFRLIRAPVSIVVTPVTVPIQQMRRCGLLVALAGEQRLVPEHCQSALPQPSHEGDQMKRQQLETLLNVP